MRRVTPASAGDVFVGKARHKTVHDSIFMTGLRFLTANNTLFPSLNPQVLSRAATVRFTSRGFNRKLIAASCSRSNYTIDSWELIK